MESRELVRRAVEFRNPPRLPFWQHTLPWAPDDVCDIWEMDRQEAGWFFDRPGMDDWGCGWARTEQENIGQVTDNPLADWSSLERYRPPNPCNPFYYERLGTLLDQARKRYVVITAHSLLFSRYHKLRGFANSMQDFYLEPERTHRLLDMILDFKLRQCEELHRRFGDRIDGLFMTDDWGTQRGTFISENLLAEFFVPRYRTLFRTIHDYGWHVILHSCGRINRFVPTLIEAGADALNMQQSQNYGLVEFGERFRGKVCFFATVDIQTTLPRGNEDEIREEARQLVEHWSVPSGGVVAFDYGDWRAIDVKPEAPAAMFREFVARMNHWTSPCCAAER